MERYMFSAPGRVELGGNHTDHQRGRVLAAAIDLDTRADVTLCDTRRVRVLSEGYEPCVVDLDDLAANTGEQGTTAALVRGVASAFAQRGCALRGMDISVSSDVPAGSGLSSSASFEIMLGKVFNTLCFDSRLTPVELALIGQRAENVYFGKPCGLMDQIACAVDGVAFVDLRDPAAPEVERIDVDLERFGHRLCVIDSGADHAGLTADYAAIPGEMRLVARYFGRDFLREVEETDFLAALPALRKSVPDRALLRAFHFFREDARAVLEADALREGRFGDFLALVNESGRSSWMYLQNVTASRDGERRPMALTLALCDALLGGRGAFRVHGGGFAGTALALVPDDMLDSFRDGAERVLGAGSCHVMSVCAEGK